MTSNSPGDEHGWSDPNQYNVILGTHPTSYAYCRYLYKACTFQDLIQRKGDHAKLGEFETLLSIAKARRVLGYNPQYTWRK